MSVRLYRRVSEDAAVDDPVTWGTKVICSLSEYQFTIDAEMVIPKMDNAKKVVRQLRTRNEGISCRQQREKVSERCIDEQERSTQTRPTVKHKQQSKGITKSSG
jgi:hypothetical protein